MLLNIRKNHFSALLLTSSFTAFALVPSVSVASEENNSDETNNEEVIVISSSTLKVETPMAETPKAVSIVTEDDLKDRKPQKLDEALRYTSGVTSQPYGSDNDTDWIKVRGFDPSIYLDGNRLFRDGYYTWLLEPYGLERIELVKGPASILFGEAPPGGVVNAVQKKPTFTPQSELRLEAGNKGVGSIGVDISDNANEDGTAQYRLVGMYKTSEGELNGTENDRYYFAPSLQLDLSNQTRLTLMATLLDDDGVPTNGFFPAYGTLIDAPEGTIDPSTNLGEPDYDAYERTQISAGYKLEHDVNSTWSLSQSFNYGYNELFLRSTYGFPSDTSTTVFRGIVYREGDNTSYTLDNKAVANWYSSNTEHTFLVGFDIQQHNNEGVGEDNFGFGSIDALNPVYGNFTPLDPANAIDRDIKKSQNSLYAQYHMKWNDKWIGVIGGRYDDIDTESESIAAAQSESRDDSQFSGNFGLMYQADNGVSPYISYSESFEVLSTIDPATGSLYKPLEGEQSEIGIKYAPAGFDGYFGVAWFDLTQTNALVTNPATFVQTQTGEVTSEGFELESVSYLTDNLKLNANYSYTKAETDDTNDQGRQQVGLIPKHNASVWLQYDATQDGAEGWNFATGVRYVGESKDNPKSSNRTVPSQTLWDAMVGYNINQAWQLQLNVTNLLDEEYISSCDYYCYYGESRRALLSATYRW